MNRVEPLWALVQRDPLLRWSTVASVALVWLAIAWAEPLVLAAVLVLASGVYVVNRRRGGVPQPDDDVDLL